MQGVKHLLECHCILPQFKNRNPTIFHKFVAFSVIDDSDTVVSTQVQCNNCGTIHKIVDLCRSEIISGKDESKLVEKVEDVSVSLPKSIVDLFKTYNLEISDYQKARFILENQMWDSTILLSSETEEDSKVGKLLRFTSRDSFRVEPFSTNIFIEASKK